MHPVLIVLLVILGLLVLFFGFLTVCWLLVDPDRQYENDSRFYRALINVPVGIMQVVVRIHVHCEGLEKIPKDQRHLIVCNHRSNYDPLLTWYALRKIDSELVFISKPANFHIPWFGRFVHRVRFLPIERDNLAQSRKTFSAASKMMMEDTASIMVYPEGKRSKCKEMLPMHPAVFIMALRAKVPVVVMSIAGTEQVVHHYPLHHTDVTLRVLEVIPAEWVAEHSMQEISDRVEKDLRKDLGLADMPEQG